MVFDKEASFEEAVITVLKQHGWDDAGGVLRYPTEQDLIDNWAKILFQNNADIDRLNGCPLTQGEMAQITNKSKRSRPHSHSTGSSTERPSPSRATTPTTRFTWARR